jgi:hypothetical protein
LSPARIVNFGPSDEFHVSVTTLPFGTTGELGARLSKVNPCGNFGIGTVVWEGPGGSPAAPALVADSLMVSVTVPTWSLTAMPWIRTATPSAVIVPSLVFRSGLSVNAPAPWNSKSHPGVRDPHGIALVTVVRSLASDPVSKVNETQSSLIGTMGVALATTIVMAPSADTCSGSGSVVTAYSSNWSPSASMIIVVVPLRRWVGRVAAR